MVKRLVLIVGTITGLALLLKKVRQQQAEQELWSQATDEVKAEPTPAPAPEAPATPTES